MKHTALIAGLALLAACSSTRSSVGDGTDARAQFETMKSLVGTWTGTAGNEKESHQVTTTYRLTGGGTTVVETMFAGAEHEMVSMYHLDNGQLMQTHYCSAGNQPRMIAASSSNPNSIAFRFLDVTNLSSEDVLHMHEMRIEKKDADHLEEWWTAWKDGKADHTAHFVLTRKK